VVFLLETKEDWQEDLKQGKEKIISEEGNKLRKEGLSVEIGSGSSYDTIKSIVKARVESRKDVIPGEVDEIVHRILGQITGYGPLQEFFVGPGAEEVVEVMIRPQPNNKPPMVLAEVDGETRVMGDHYFVSNNELLEYADKLCQDVGKTYSESAPLVVTWLPDGSRVTIMGFKASPLGVVMIIRKSPVTRSPMPMGKLVGYNMLPAFAAELIGDVLVRGHANIGYWGRTGCGKTTFMRAAGISIDVLERLFIAEVYFEIFMPNLLNSINLVEVKHDGKLLVGLHDLAKMMNISNPDRAWLGEVKGEEIIAALQMATSLAGFWCTGHAETMKALRSRIWTLFFLAGVSLPKDFLDEVIASMFHFVIFLGRETVTPKKKRILLDIVEVSPNGDHKTIISFDRRKFAETKGQVHQWKYVNPISEENLMDMAFKGAVIKSEYEKVHKEILI
jgi:pilus assembly protein CpaF